MRTAGLLLFCLVLSAPPALAQQRGPIPGFVFDIRGFYSGLGQDPTTASGLSLSPEQLPSRGLGGVAGLHVYPVRTRTFAIGFGGEGLLARGRTQQRDPATGVSIGLPVTQQLRGLSGAMSLNFGSANGWSYLTAGMGPMSFATYSGDTTPADSPPAKMTLNMGGGARWFIVSHLAFEFDVRFYLTRPEVITPAYPGRQRNRLMVLSAGIGIK
jgi:hypothetical protein